MTSPSGEGPIYPGTCRDGIPFGRQARSERLRVGATRIQIEDRIHGRITQDLATEVGDFVLRRADGLHAYQLAVVVDDAAQGIDSIVRGADLLLSTPRQVYLQQLLGLPRPGYAHLPLVIDDTGRKLSKSLAAAPVDATDPLPTLLRAWRLLGQTPMPELPGSVAEFWHWAALHWRIERVPRGRILPWQPVPAEL
jgi:glutamyl-Q tRNA(Asp) synthetase